MGDYYNQDLNITDLTVKLPENTNYVTIQPVLSHPDQVASGSTYVANMFDVRATS